MFALNLKKEECASPKQDTPTVLFCAYALPLNGLLYE